MPSAWRCNDQDCSHVPGRPGAGPWRCCRWFLRGVLPAVLQFGKESVLLIPYTHLIAAVISAAAAVSGTYWVMDGRHAIELKAISDKQTKKDNEHAELHRTQERDLYVLEQKRGRHVTDALNAARARAPAHRADDARARDAVERVRDKADAAAVAARASHQACIERADTLRVVFQACSAEYREVGALAGRHADDAQTLTDAWPE